MAKPTKAALERLYVEEQKSLNDIAAIFGVVASTVSRWLETCSIPRRERMAAIALQKERADAKDAQLQNEPEAKLALASESQTSGILELNCGAADPLNALPDDLDEEDVSAFGRLNRRMQRAAIIYADISGEALNYTDRERAETIGINEQTLREYLKDPNFREAVIDLQTSETRFIVKFDANKDLVRLLKSGKLNSKDRETVLKWLGDLGPDTQINFNSFGHARILDGRIRGF